MSVERERLSRLRDMAWELHEFADEVLREFDAAEDATTSVRLSWEISGTRRADGKWGCRSCGAVLPSDLTLYRHRQVVHPQLRSVADLRDDADQGRAEDHILGGDIA